MFDAIIVGGSYAGLSAAMQLGRARRRVLVIDAGERRNRFASSSHGFLGRDGATPESIAAEGRAQVLAYPTIQWKDGRVTETRAVSGGFSVRTAEAEYQSRRLILATGVVDELPDIPGLRERWGVSAFHCPYCHGYELGRGRIGVLGTIPLAIHHAALVAEWGAAGATTLLTHQSFVPTPEELAELAERGIRHEPARITSVEGVAPSVSLRFDDGRDLALDGLFVMPRTRLAAPFAEQLGCAVETGPTGVYYKTDFTKETTVPGVFACGDSAIAGGSVAFAVADGMMAGVATHRSLVFRREGAAA
jgi:thioredoxin reductase